MLGSRLTISVAAAILMAFAAWAPLHASEPIDLTWEDLIPPRPPDYKGELSRLAFGVATHGSVSVAPGEGKTLDRLVRDHDGKRVRLAGYVVPLEYDGFGVTEFFLVPYVGACIHVPPPPPNQLVYVNTDPGFEAEGLFQAVYVTGTLSSAPEQEVLDLAGHGYRIDADEITPFE